MLDNLFQFTTMLHSFDIPIKNSIRSHDNFTSKKVFLKWALWQYVLELIHIQNRIAKEGIEEKKLLSSE